MPRRIHQKESGNWGGELEVWSEELLRPQLRNGDPGEQGESRVGPVAENHRRRGHIMTPTPR